MVRYIDIPAKVLDGVVNSAVGHGYWPYNDGRGDPFWMGGVTPKDYQWVIQMGVTPQVHSSHRTRRPFAFDATDIKVGDYIASQDGVALEITSILSKTTDSITCIVEDRFRYNTFRSTLADGLFGVPANVVIFETNEEGMPIVDPVPSNGVTGNFYANLMSRFQNMEQTVNFLLHKAGHDFKQDELIAADPETNSFVRADADHPFIVGTISYTDLGPDNFMINPIQKVENSFPALPGNVGDVLYASNDTPGAFSLTGSHPVLIKLRNNTYSTILGTMAAPTTAPGSVVKINDVLITIDGLGAADDFVSAINNATATHGVVAHLVSAPTVAASVSSDFALGEPALTQTPGGPYPTATINGVTVTFSTMDAGHTQYGADYSLEEDMAADINAANIPDVTATVDTNVLKITCTSGPVTIVNGVPDSSGNPFAGPASGSGVPLFTPEASDSYVRLDAVDARPINLFDVSGTAINDFGLVSVENGIKAAGLYVEQGIRQASTYVVTNIAARDALTVLFGDQCFVQDKGNGEWAHYIHTFDSTWVKVADKDSSETDAQSVEIELTPASAVSGTIHVVSTGSRVTFVTADVVIPFNGNSTLTVGDAADPARLMTNEQVDLTAGGSYSTTPSYRYSTGSDTAITYNLGLAGSTVGKVVITITYT